MNEFIRKIAGCIDQTLLMPNSTRNQVEELCRDALDYGFASVCVLPHFVLTANKHLSGTDVKVSTVIGFPLGGTYTSAKLAEAEKAIECGAQELDMMINLAALASGDLDIVREDIEAVTEFAHLNGALLKVIIETCLLSDEQKIQMCKIVTEAEADFIKTSTGFSNCGATVADILLLRKHCGPNVRVKASGGIRNAGFAVELVESGADRVGTSSGVKIIHELLDL